MKLLFCHDYYRDPGGENLSFEDEFRLLEAGGVEVLTYIVHNESIERIGRFAAARNSVWNRRAYQDVRRIIRRERPEILHCSNLFPLISPSVHAAARAEGVPVLQELRNYRLLCPNALFFRDGAPCEDCLGRAVPWPGVIHACYRGSRSASAVVAGMMAIHRRLDAWRHVDLFVTPSEFTRRKHIEAGIPAERIVVKPNFVSVDPGPGAGQGGYAVFVGRFSPEKGLGTLLEAWSRMPGSCRLKMVGDGPMAEEVRAAARRDPRIEWHGWRSAGEVLELVGEATLLVMPSLVYETFGRTIVEAFASGTPVVASRLGAMAELVEEGRTGALFQAGNPDELAAAVTRLLADPQQLARMRIEARREYESKFTADHAFEVLMGLYRRLLSGALPPAEPSGQSLTARTGVAR